MTSRSGDTQGLRGDSPKMRLLTLELEALNANPCSSPPSTSRDGATLPSWERILIASAFAGVAASSLCLYLALTYPIVRPPDWDGGMRYRVLIGSAKWGSLTTIILGSVGYMKSGKSSLEKIYLIMVMSPAIVVIGLYVMWLILFA